jgi:hypothetical protein
LEAYRSDALRGKMYPEEWISGNLGKGMGGGYLERRQPPPLDERVSPSLFFDVCQSTA